MGEVVAWVVFDMEEEVAVSELSLEDGYLFVFSGEHGAEGVVTYGHLVLTFVLDGIGTEIGQV
jgi:hypothetical protein